MKKRLVIYNSIFNPMHNPVIQRCAEVALITIFLTTIGNSIRICESNNHLTEDKKNKAIVSATMDNQSTIKPVATLIPLENIKQEPVKVVQTTIGPDGTIINNMVDGIKYSLKYPDVTPEPTKRH